MYCDRTLKHVAQYSPLLSENIKKQIQQTPPQQQVKQRFPADQLPLSELPQLLNKQITLDIPVYTVWGACEDVRVLERFRSGEYKVHNLHIIDEANSRLLDVGGVKLRLLGLGGAVVCTSSSITVKERPPLLEAKVLCGPPCCKSASSSIL